MIIWGETLLTLRFPCDFLSISVTYPLYAVFLPSSCFETKALAYNLNLNVAVEAVQ